MVADVYNYNSVPVYSAPLEVSGYVAPAPLVVGAPVTYNIPNFGVYPAQAPVVLANYGPSVFPALNFAPANQDPIYDTPAYSANYRALEPDTVASVTKVKVDRPAPAVSYEAGLGKVTL